MRPIEALLLAAIVVGGCVAVDDASGPPGAVACTTDESCAEGEVCGTAGICATPDCPPGTERSWRLDQDGDGFGDDATDRVACVPPTPANWIEVGGDCDDGDPDAFPTNTAPGACGWPQLQRCDPAILRDCTLEESADLSIHGTFDGDFNFGQRITSGDLDGDGAVDLVVGAFAADRDPELRRRVVLRFGPIGPDGRGAREILLDGAEKSLLGIGGVVARDLDADGRTDLALTAGAAFGTAIAQPLAHRGADVAVHGAILFGRTQDEWAALAARFPASLEADEAGVIAMLSDVALRCDPAGDLDPATPSTTGLIVLRAGAAILLDAVVPDGGSVDLRVGAFATLPHVVLPTEGAKALAGAEHDLTGDGQVDLVLALPSEGLPEGQTTLVVVAEGPFPVAAPTARALASLSLRFEPVADLEFAQSFAVRAVPEREPELWVAQRGGNDADAAAPSNGRIHRLAVRGGELRSIGSLLSPNLRGLGYQLCTAAPSDGAEGQGHVLVVAGKSSPLGALFYGPEPLPDGVVDAEASASLRIAGGYEHCAVLPDMNQDGRPELAISRYEDERLFVILGPP